MKNGLGGLPRHFGPHRAPIGLLKHAYRTSGDSKRENHSIVELSPGVVPSVSSTRVSSPTCALAASSDVCGYAVISAPSSLGRGLEYRGDRMFTRRTGRVSPTFLHPRLLCAFHAPQPTPFFAQPYTSPPIDSPRPRFPLRARLCFPARPCFPSSSQFFSPSSNSHQQAAIGRMGKIATLPTTPAPTAPSPSTTISPAPPAPVRRPACAAPPATRASPTAYAGIAGTRSTGAKAVVTPAGRVQGV